MCLEDIQLGRASRSAVTVVTVTTTSGRVLGRSDRRVEVIFHPPDTNMVWVSIGGTAVVGRGVLMVPSSLPQRYTIDDDGDMSMRDWSAISDVGSPVMEIWERFLDHRL